MPCRVLLSGATGAMGRAITGLASADPDFDIDGRVSGSQPLPESSQADVLIDFSAPEQTRRCLEWCRGRGMPLVIGTTGLDSSDHSAIGRAAAHIPVCLEANFSIGIHLLYRLVAQAAATLGEDFETEILELHHRRKVDAPSGTALALAGLLAGAGQGETVTSRADRPGAREPGEVGIGSLRGGDVAGEHTVFFLGDGERIELSHRATGREIFARGALRAGALLAGRDKGLYGFSDLLMDGRASRPG